ncbi:hypothetical protein [Streptomyces millisiae]|uniref:Uncharacterized protein n=1 Tax=Streptomyces millisiae TaxID=3075542 RepID=A0ABU2LH87_9ACTN|nr:hypothetical protein [Streptomyces sp. DSM 44918]MDT0316954.1 hypothetical protein [Streptomyces sp. DSM 44918]
MNSPSGYSPFKVSIDMTATPPVITPSGKTFVRPSFTEAGNFFSYKQLMDWVREKYKKEPARVSFGDGTDVPRWEEDAQRILREGGYSSAVMIIEAVRSESLHAPDPKSVILKTFEYQNHSEEEMKAKPKVTMKFVDSLTTASSDKWSWGVKLGTKYEIKQTGLGPTAEMTLGHEWGTSESSAASSDYVVEDTVDLAVPKGETRFAKLYAAQRRVTFSIVYKIEMKGYAVAWLHEENDLGTPQVISLSDAATGAGVKRNPIEYKENVALGIIGDSKLVAEKPKQ